MCYLPISSKGNGEDVLQLEEQAEGWVSYHSQLHITTQHQDGAGGERETTMNAQHRHYQPARLKLCVCLPRLKRSIYCSDSQQMLGVLIHSCLLYHSKQFVLPPYPRTSKSTTFIKKKKKRVLLFFKNLFPSCPS